MDTDAIMAEHTGWHACGPADAPHRFTRPEGGCLPYRLAVELAAERAKVQRETLEAIRSMPLGYRPQDVADELEHADFRTTRTEVS